MESLLHGALVGGGIGLVLFLFEYVLVTARARERANRLKRKAELDPTERKNLRSVAGFCVILPFAFAGAFWVITS